MQSIRSDPGIHQRRVDDHFDATARHWKDLYEEPTLDGLIHQQRHAIALRWIDELKLPLHARVLDVGCGAGLLAIDLAARGFTVDAIDTSEAMVALASTSVDRAGRKGAVTVSLGDVHQLALESRSKDLIVALGVLPFLHSPATALREMRRVLTPGGFAVFTSDNIYRLNHLLDPRYVPIFSPLKRRLRALAHRRAVVPNRYSLATLQATLRAAGLQSVRTTVLGFGPFSLLGWHVLPDSAGIRLHRRLQALADAGTPGLRSTGAQHIVVARVNG